MHFGIDFGSKKSGNTAVCLIIEGKLQFFQSDKNADTFLERMTGKFSPEYLFIDAPLSLPGIYSHKKGFSDYFYRAADREVKGMSPMFLGALSARAIKFRHKMENKGIKVIETYPTLVAEKCLKVKKRKEKMEQVSKKIEKLSGYYLEKQPENPHQLDALLAWWSGVRFFNNHFLLYGDEKEGSIII